MIKNEVMRTCGELEDPGGHPGLTASACMSSKASA
jgi:hypothetical protein